MPAEGSTSRWAFDPSCNIGVYYRLVLTEPTKRPGLFGLSSPGKVQQKSISRLRRRARVLKTWITSMRTRVRLLGRIFVSVRPSVSPSLRPFFIHPLSVSTYEAPVCPSAVRLPGAANWPAEIILRGVPALAAIKEFVQPGGRTE